MRNTDTIPHDQDTTRSSFAGLRASIAAHALHAKYDSRELTAPARMAFMDRFEREVDPDFVLDTMERARRAQHAKKAYFRKLALQSVKARRAA